jgi:uncharacterized protein
MLPSIDDDTRPFWTAGATGALRLPFCASCDRWIFPPVLRCPHCDHTVVYRPLSGKARVFSYTVNHHAFNPQVPVPYVIAIVELVEQDGLRFTTNLINCPPERAHVGLPVRVFFEQQGDIFVPLFEPDPEA